MAQRLEKVAADHPEQIDGPGGRVTTQPNMHLTKNVFIGETRADGQFKIMESYEDVYGEPWLKGKFK